MKILCVIPSRIASTRLPRKALLPIGGVPMVQRVYQQAKKCAQISRVIVATDSAEIAAVLQAAGAGEDVMMTDATLATGSDRVAAVAHHFPEAEVVINLQGDEPFVQPEMLAGLVEPYLQGERPEMSTLAYQLDPADYPRPEIVKVLVDQHNYALYFSRASIPYLRSDKYTLPELPVYHHMGVYAFRGDFLQRFCHLPQTKLELAESLEQLRALEFGYRIKVCVTTGRTLEINTLQDYQQAEERVKAGEL